MSVAIKEIDCLPTFVSMLSSSRFFLAVYLVLLQWTLLAYLKYVVEYLKQTAFMPQMHEFWDL